MANARIIAIHAIAIPLYPTAYGGEISLPEYYEASRKFAEEWMEKIVNMAKQENVDARMKILTEVVSVVDAVITYAKKRDADLIVIGTRGRTGLKKFLLGSVAQGVSQHAPCSVLIVR